MAGDAIATALAWGKWRARDQSPTHRQATLLPRNQAGMHCNEMYITYAPRPELQRAGQK